MSGDEVRQVVLAFGFVLVRGKRRKAKSVSLFTPSFITQVGEKRSIYHARIVTVRIPRTPFFPLPRAALKIVSSQVIVISLTRGKRRSPSRAELPL